MRLGIAGGGRAAWAFGSTWRARNLPLSGISLRPASTSIVPSLLQTTIRPLAELAATSDYLLFALPDSLLPEVCGEAWFPGGARLFHASGAETSAIFPNGSLGFSLHPLRALPPPGEAVDLAGSLFVFEGPEESRAGAAAIARAIDAEFTVIQREAKPLYHAAAVFASNYTAALLSVSESQFARAGLDPVGMRRHLVALARSASDNWLMESDSRRFTGPLVRGDAGTVGKHLVALEAEPLEQQLYALLGVILGKFLIEGTDTGSEIGTIVNSLKQKLMLP